MEEYYGRRSTLQTVRPHHLPSFGLLYAGQLVHAPLVFFDMLSTLLPVLWIRIPFINRLPPSNMDLFTHATEPDLMLPSPLPMVDILWYTLYI